MPDKKNNLFLYEALELRGEYKSRISTLKKLLPENVNQRSPFGGSDLNKPVKNFEPKKVREKIKKLEYKQRKLNNAIQLANFENKIKVNNEKMLS